MTKEDDSDITRPGTPNSLDTMKTILARLNYICTAVDRLEVAERQRARKDSALREASEKASAEALRARREAEFANKRADALVLRIQALEGASR